MNFKKVTMKVLSVLMAAMMLLGVCAPVMSAASLQDRYPVTEEESAAAVAEATETLKAAAKKGYAFAYGKALENGMIDRASALILKAVEELKGAKAYVDSYTLPVAPGFEFGEDADIEIPDSLMRQFVEAAEDRKGEALDAIYRSAEAGKEVTIK